MALSITLSQQEGHVYSPGGLVPGIVKLVTASDQPIGDVIISLAGRSKVLLISCYGSVAPNSDYKSIEYFFYRGQSLYHGQHAHRAGTYVWPFVFQLPDFTEPDVGRCRLDSGVTTCQRLPSSMNHYGSFHCGIEYVLEASHILPRKDHKTLPNNDLHVSRHIKVRQSGGAPCLEVDSERPYQVYNHDCRIRSSPRSLGTRFTSLIRQTPHSSRRGSDAGFREIRISLLVPKRLESTSELPLPIFVSAFSEDQGQGENNEPQDMDHAQPIVHIRRFVAWIVVKTAVHVGKHHSSTSNRIRLAKGSCDVTITRSADKSGLPRYTEDPEAMPTAVVNLGQVADWCLLSSLTVPDFSTGNISRTHSLELKFCMEYMGNRFKFTSAKMPFVVVGRPCNSLPSYEMRDTTPTLLSSTPEDDECDEQLPAYGG